MAEPVIGTRRRLVLLAIAVASLASIATSASPSPPPSLSRSIVGAFQLTREQPVASVEFEVSANAALRSQPSSRTVVKVGRTPGGQDDGPTPVLIAVEPLAVRDTGPSVASWPNYQSQFDDACQAGADCTRRYRITAMLADPAGIDEPIDVNWTAVAESRISTDAAPGSIPPDGTLTLVALDPVIKPATSIVGAALANESLRLDAASPRFRQRVVIGQPEGSGGFADIGFGAMLRVTRTLDDPSDSRRGQDVTVVDAEGRLFSRADHGDNIQVELLPCATAGGCSTEVWVVGDWNGGAVGSGLTLDWSLTAVAFAAGDEKTRPAAGSVTLDTDPVVVGALQPVGETAGSFDVGGRDVVDRRVTVLVDLDAVHGDVEGALFAQATFTATTTSRSGADGNIRIAINDAYAMADDGSDLTVVSHTLPVDCSTGVCHVTMGLSTSAYDRPDDDVSVDWTLSVGLLAEPPASVDPGTTARFDVVDRP